MAHFTNQFDKICTDLGSSVIYCHHHSKGSQGGKKSMDRASGSGVFARDPDALIDLVELDVGDTMKRIEENKLQCQIYRSYIERHSPDYLEKIRDDDLMNSLAMEEHAKNIQKLPSKLSKPESLESIQKQIADKLQSIKIRSAWRVEGTLREYPKFEPINMWFQYPIHIVDDEGILKDVDPESERPPWIKATDKRKSKVNKEHRNKAEEFDDVISSCNFGEPPTVQDVVEWFTNSGKQVAERTVRDWVKKYGYEIQTQRIYKRK
jgi:RecA-family ATPase